MITWMQKHRKYLVVTIWISTIAFVGAGFVGWGAYSYNGQTSGSVAKVGDIEISGSEFQSSYDNIYGYYNNLFGGKLTKEKAKQMNLQDIALQRVINDAVLLNYAKEIGIDASEDDIKKEYLSIKAFQDKKGSFSKSIYKQALSSRGINPKNFEKDILKSVILKKLDSALNLPATALEDDIILSAATLSDHLVVKKITQNIEEIKIDDKEISQYWESHKNDYMSQTSYTISSIKIPFSQMTTTEEEIKSFYDEKKYKYKGSDGKILSLENAKDQVVSDLQKKIAKKEILKKYLAFKKGKIKSEDTQSVDAINTKFDIGLLKDKKSGDYIKSVELPDSYMTLKVDSITPPEPLSLSDSKTPIEAKLKSQKAIALLEDKAKKESLSLNGGDDIGFVSVKDSDKIKNANPMVAEEFIKYVFSNNKKNGYFINGNSAFLYNIKEQKLDNDELNASMKQDLLKSLSSVKNNVIKTGLIKKLKKKYKIEQFIKKEG